MCWHCSEAKKKKHKQSLDFIHTRLAGKIQKMGISNLFVLYVVSNNGTFGKDLYACRMCDIFEQSQFASHRWLVYFCVKLLTRLVYFARLCLGCDDFAWHCIDPVCTTFPVGKSRKKGHACLNREKKCASRNWAAWKKDIQSLRQKMHRKKKKSHIFATWVEKWMREQ